jgi:hypothetical protein
MASHLRDPILAVAAYLFVAILAALALRVI